MDTKTIRTIKRFVTEGLNGCLSLRFKKRKSASLDLVRIIKDDY